jgi:hypothetical protein
MRALPKITILTQWSLKELPISCMTCSGEGEKNFPTLLHHPDSLKSTVVIVAASQVRAESCTSALLVLLHFIKVSVTAATFHESLARVQSRQTAYLFH